MDISICICTSKSILTRYRHLYKRTEELNSVKITRSIREIFGTAHILNAAPKKPRDSYDSGSEISEAPSNLSNAFEEAVTDDNTSGNIFICPLCGQDFSHIRTFSNHNKREHNSKIVQLDMFSYEAGKTQSGNQEF